MNNFEYARPETEVEALELLNEPSGGTAVLAGGTDLLNLLKADLLAPERVVDVKHVSSLEGVSLVADGVQVGALTTLAEMQAHPLLRDYRSLADVIDATRAVQIQSMGTLGGDLCHLPNCWYYRNGYGLLGLQDGRSLPAEGDNRYHAVFGNRGPAKFVNASRFAPALIAWGARVRVIGPDPDAFEWIPLESFYVTPKTAGHGVTLLKPGQLITHVLLPPARSVASASYEVMQMEGLDWPLAAAAACLDVEGGLVRDARIAMGHVAPVPWVPHAAALMLRGRALNAETADRAGEMAVAGATPLSNNSYKVQLARTAVKRALLRAAGQLEGGL